jgi:hypothetical protein
MNHADPVKRRAVAMALGALAMAIASSFACRQIVDFREGPPVLAQAGADASAASADAAAEAGAACGFGYATDRCASCVSARCCPASSACATDPACEPYASCVGACAGDPTCRAQCELDPPDNSSEGPPLSACLAARCESECGLTCGSVEISSAGPDAAAACQSCIVANGCAVARACAASVECAARRLRFYACPAADCKEACDEGHDAGSALSAALGGVAEGKCFNACATGADWSCVGHVNWQRPKSDTVTMTIEVRDFTNRSTTYGGIDVKACDRKDLECTNAKAHGTTNEKGSVVLQFPNPLSTGNLGLDGYVQLQSSPDAGADTKIIPWLYYWGFPLSEPQFALANIPGWTLAIQSSRPPS